ncbi:hypothetical protein ACTID9_00920 [Brevibacillus fluminis]|uniref:hypothetical protein n=1 Tax=Brevibacillus fluminis TaxID=511487 RepID=UPI003F8A555A
MRKTDIVVGQVYSNGHPVGSRYRTVRKVLDIYNGHYRFTDREETLVRFVCTEGKYGDKGRESEITLQAFATWAKEVV